MLGKIRLGSRLVLLIAVQTIVLIVFGVTALFGLNFAANTSNMLNNNVIEQVKLNQLNEVVRSDLLETANKMSTGKLSWEIGQEYLMAAKALFANNWEEYKEGRSKQETDEIQAALGNDYKNVISAVERLETLTALRDQAQLSVFIDKELNKLVTPFLTELNERVNEQQLISEELFSSAIAQNQRDLYQSFAVMGIGLLIASILGYFIYRSIVKPINQISGTVSKVAQGDYHVRTNITGQDELGQLGVAFDNLLQDKVATLVQAEKENELLNESVIVLLQAVSKLSQRDLTVKVPVTEDVTGPVADALNHFTSETSRVLQGVRRISEEVARASATVKSQSDTVIKVAHDEQHEVLETIKALAQAVDAMTHIAELAKAGNLAAENAIKTTHTALETVDGTVKSINNIRETIHETEKRIKRLGERSQEISRAVNLINSISERTHILALNASMHAASAGEAGKGFAVVADEVQRLAENARDATNQIATLVHNIQVETSDTVTTMNNVISQVVDGTHMAEQAGAQMRKTRESTENLVSSVREIALSSAQQAQRSHELRSRADSIHASATKTTEHLGQQSLITTRLVEYARSLLKAVQVFKLPGISSDKDSKPSPAADVIKPEFDKRKVS